MHHHAQLMHPSCYPPLLWNAIKRLNKIEKCRWTDLQQPHQKQMARCEHLLGMVYKTVDQINVPKNLDSDYYTTAKKRRSRKSNPGPATWGLTSSRICMSRQTRAQATASAWLKQVCFSGPSLNRCHFRQQLPLWDPSEHPSPNPCPNTGNLRQGTAKAWSAIWWPWAAALPPTAGKLIEARDFSMFLYQRIIG